MTPSPITPVEPFMVFAAVFVFVVDDEGAAEVEVEVKVEIDDEVGEEVVVVAGTEK